MRRGSRSVPAACWSVCLLSIYSAWASGFPPPAPPACMSPYPSVSMCKSLSLCLASCLSSLCIIYIPCVCLCSPASLSDSLLPLSCDAGCLSCLTTSILLDGSAIRCLPHAGPPVCFTASVSHQEKKKSVEKESSAPPKKKSNIA